jgi:hypothetical protein
MPPLLVWLAVLVFIYHTSQTFYLLNQLEPLASVDYIYKAAFLCAIAWWIQGENRKYRMGRFYCDGVLVNSGWMILIPYYLLKTRGLRGFIPLLVLVAVFIAAQFVAVVAYLLIGNRG